MFFLFDFLICFFCFFLIFNKILDFSFLGGVSTHNIIYRRIEGFTCLRDVESMKALTYFACHFMSQTISIHENIAPFYDTIMQTEHFFP